MKKKSVRALAVIMCLMTAVAFMPAFAFATTDSGVTAKVKYAVSVAGSLQVQNKNITVKDTNGDGIVDVKEALKQIHKANKKAITIKDGQITKFWSKKTTVVSYYINDAMAWGVTDELKDGDYLYAFTFKDQASWTDVYASIKNADGKRMVSIPLYKVIDLGTTVYTYDENWNLVPDTNYDFSKITIKVNGKKQKGIDVFQDGSFRIGFSKAGTYYISAVASEGIITPPVFKVVVK